MNKITIKFITIIGIMIFCLILFSNVNETFGKRTSVETDETKAADAHANAAKEAKKEWDKGIYGTGDGKNQTVKQTINVEDIDNLKKQDKIKNNYFDLGIYSGMKLDIMYNKVLIEAIKAEKKQKKMPVSKVKTVSVSVKGMTYIKAGDIETYLTSRQQKEYLSKIKAWEKQTNIVINDIESMKSSSEILGLRSYEKDLNKRKEDAKTIKKYLNNAIKNGKNADKVLGTKSENLSNKGATNSTLSDDFVNAVNDSDEARKNLENQDGFIDAELPERKLGYSDLSVASKETNVDETINEANNFIGKAQTDKIDQSNLSKAIKSLYYILLAIAIVAAVIIGTYIAVKVITSSAEGKAKMKEMFVPYVIGCIVSFGAFGIWALIMKMFNAM